MQFAGKVVLVTGAQQGIGRAMALEFAAAGADAAVNRLDDVAPPKV
ncbi:MAG TPA: SDR family NAD(P)-dependent oxidoreductase [Stellaceae bacterium]|jgi:3-oxoacyl-[acyl-carrier protein] reductase|nr:SDR family NAD(P)-dependent oxidoreductase [Stellaceae bacterium]